MRLDGDAHLESGDAGLHVAQMKMPATCIAGILVIIAVPALRAAFQFRDP
jgi:hypothetical protein